MAVGDQRARVLYRLPEQRRFGASGVPSLLTLVLLAVVLFLGGMVVGRATLSRDPSGAAASATSPPAATAAPSPTVAATPGSTAAPATAVEGAGPSRVEHGVGVGYQRSRAGAVAAAATYTQVLSSSLILDDAKRRAAIDTLAAPKARARLQKTFDQAVASMRKGFGATGPAADNAQVLMRATPVGWRVDNYGDDAATVAIWVTSVGGSVGGANGPVPVREGWGTTTVALGWARGDWKLVETTSTDGPVPIADVAPPTAAPDLIGAAEEFKEFIYAPGP
ncbi:MAG TPA: hypothetical protein VHM23_16075 [Actinomycetota bacterium]|jgi:hypothetical protein|nr:hypothetical protein [Actinomycetota bacterium]